MSRRRQEKKASKRQVGAYSRRIALMGLLLAIFIGICVGRLAQLQLVQGDELAAKAETQHMGKVDYFAKRGKILDRGLNVLALTIETSGIEVIGGKVKHRRYVVDYIAGLLALDRRTAEKKAFCGRERCEVRRFVDPKLAAPLENILKYDGDDSELLWQKDMLSGVQVRRAAARLYPFRELAGQVIGVARVPQSRQADGSLHPAMKLEGQGGIEADAEEILSGKPIRQKGQKRSKQGLSLLADNPDLVLQGNSVVLTLDVKVQEIAEEELARAVITSLAKSGIAVVQDVATGELLAIAHYPPFNPNGTAEYSKDEWWKWLDRAFRHMFEPGSTVKPLVLAMALEEGVITMDDVLFCENGLWKVDSREKPIRDTHAHGFLTAWDVIKLSSNICAGKMGLKVGSARVYEYLQAFGFGTATGAKLNREARGRLPKGGKWCDLELANISFGQGLSVTAVQLVSAIAALGNGGKLMQPILLKEVLDASGNVLWRNTPEVKGTPVSEESAARAVEAMARVLEPGGTGERALVYGFDAAGKTGTAQKVLTVEDPHWEPGGERKAPYRKSRYVDLWTASFVGLVPAGAPKLAIVVLVDEPYMSHYGGVVAGPAFSKIASRTLTYLNVAPSYERRHHLAQARKKEARQPVGKEPAEFEASDRPGGVGPAMVPDFTGMTVRKALVAAWQSRVRLSAAGSGVAVRQEPPPEAVVGEWSRVTVTFRGTVASAGEEK